MDYGYQVLKHAVQQVFGNLGAAARITLPLAAIPTIVLVLTNRALVTGAVAPDQINALPPGVVSEVNVLWLLLAICLSVLCWCWAAVAWHRFVLLEEYPVGALPRFSGDRIGAYFGYTLLVGLIMIGVGFGMGLVIGIVVAITQSLAIATALGIGLIVGLSWIATRVGLVLPAAAVAARFTISESWNVTKPVSGQLLLPIIVIALVATVLNQILVSMLGATILAVVVTGVVSWLQLLVNLALMTTLYGNLVEGRQLN